MAVKAQVEKLLPPPASSFLYKTRREHFGVYWHFHPEYQLTLVTRGRGRRFVGDHVGRFGPGDLVLTGPNLPHMWCSGSSTREGRRPDESLMIQFPEGLLGASLLGLPEMTSVRRLLEISRRGVRFEGSARDQASRAMARMGTLRGPARVIALLDILRLLAEAPRPQVLSSRALSPADRAGERERIDQICRLIAERASGPFQLAEAAAAAHMSVPAFTRFFKKRTKKTFVEYLTEIRIGNACRLLVETDTAVRRIAAAVGFSSLTNFNRRFRDLKGMSPQAFRQQFST
ncbi:MAG TPA: AraC family transcriptional regulator [Planctomycetota bacterium]|jgi:AraC-like DNA-binding protein|nr:AraC family transcriptional regulator [Planctomycetota bacterium]